MNKNKRRQEKLLRRNIKNINKIKKAEEQKKQYQILEDYYEHKIKIKKLFKTVIEFPVRYYTGEDILPDVMYHINKYLYRFNLIIREDNKNYIIYEISDSFISTKGNVSISSDKKSGEISFI